MARRAARRLRPRARVGLRARQARGRERERRGGRVHGVLRLDQHRVHGVHFNVGVLTNISHEHLDYHKSIQEYMDVKARLLINSDVAVINHDDSSYSFMSQKLEGKKVVSYGLTTSANSNLINHRFKTDLLGDFNKLNILAALTVVDILGIDPGKSSAAIASFKLPVGRIDKVYDKDFKIIIDFAHTPNALDNILKTFKNGENKGRIIHVFGSAGGRDLSKRPLMGEASGKYSDIIILTSEDPRTESPEKIAEDIRSGIDKDHQNISFINDRQQAISNAIRQAKKDDIVIITGKGHEKSMNMGHGEETWSDYKAVEGALKELGIRS